MSESEKVKGKEIMFRIMSSVFCLRLSCSLLSDD